MKKYIDSNRVDDRVVVEAATILKDGGIIIYPTDTLYGIGCAVSNKKAINRLFDIKRRRSNKPFSFICSSIKMASNFAQINNQNFRILNSTLPGSYTYILPAKKSTPKILQSNLKTVGIRIPDSIWPLSIVEELGEPIVSTSLKIENFFDDTDMASIEDYYEFLVDMLLLDYNVDFENYSSSTVVDLTQKVPEIIRKGKGDTSLFIGD